jgi:predicted MFS family arabinose efflux permease
LASLVSNIGTWMETVALGYDVTNRTDQAKWAAIIAAAGFVPTGLLSPFGGLVADRFSRKLVIAVGSLVSCAIALAMTLLYAGDDPAPVVVAVLVFITGCSAALTFPSFQVAIRELVPPDELPAAIGLGSVTWNLGRVVGPAIAGVTISLFGIVTALAINTASFLAVTIAAVVVSLPKPKRDAITGSVGSQLAAGWQAMRAEPGLWLSFRMMCLNTFIAAPFIALIPAVAKKVLDGSEGTNAVLTTAQGVGAVIAALSLSRLSARFPPHRAVPVAMAANGAALVLYGLAPGLFGLAAMLVLLGGAYMWSLNTFSLVAQTRSPDIVRGRVMALNNMVLGIAYPIGAYLQGDLADEVGLREVTATSGVVMLLVVAAVALLGRDLFARLAPLERAD